MGEARLKLLEKGRREFDSQLGGKEREMVMGAMRHWLRDKWAIIRIPAYLQESARSHWNYRQGRSYTYHKPAVLPRAICAGLRMEDLADGV